MSHHTTNAQTFKELETTLFRLLQAEFATLMAHVLEEWDTRLMQERDTKRFRYKDRREASVDTVFGTIRYTRRLYVDRETGKTVYLLDQVLQFDGSQGLSPHLEEIAVRWATDGPSYRAAADRIEEFLGYRPLSHEAIRKRLLEAAQQEETWRAKKLRAPRVLFVEVDGLHVKLQRQKQKTMEHRMAIVHEGWVREGRRVRLKAKRHFKHEGKEEFWSAFGEFLLKYYDMDENTWLVVGGDGAPWIGECTSYFHRCIYMLDRFHVARDLKRFIGHLPEVWQRVRKMLAAGDGHGLAKLVREIDLETIANEQREEWRKYVGFIDQHAEHLTDYRQILQAHGIDTSGMRPMGSAEAQMRVFARRTKRRGYSWSKQGSSAIIRMIIASKENWHREDEQQVTGLEPVKVRVRNILQETRRPSVGVVNGTLPILHGRDKARPLGEALKALSGRIL